MFHPDFFGYVMLTIEEQLASAGEGASGQTELARSKLENEFRVSFPASVLEQEHIVAILDEAFRGIATAKLRAEKNLCNVRELFEVYRESSLQRPPPHWRTAQLRDLMTVKHGFAFESRYFGEQGEHVLLTPGNFYEAGGFRSRGDRQKMYSGPVPKGFILSPGSFLVAMTEQAAGLLGSPVIVPDGGPYLHNQRLGLIKAKEGISWSDRFFFHVFNCASFRRELHDTGTGTKVRHTSPEKIGAVSVSFPPTLGEQMQVAEKLDQLQKEVVTLETVQRRKLAALAELKQTLLARAFSGKLTRGDAVAA